MMPPASLWYSAMLAVALLVQNLHARGFREQLSRRRRVEGLAGLDVHGFGLVLLLARK